MRSLKKLLIVPGSCLLPFHPEWILYRLLGLVLAFLLVHPLLLLVDIVWPLPLRPRSNHLSGATHSSSSAPLWGWWGDECSLLDQPCEWFLLGFEDLDLKVFGELFVIFFPPLVFMRCLKKDDSDLSFSLLLLNLLTCSFYRQCIFLPDFWTTDMIKLV